MVHYAYNMNITTHPKGLNLSHSSNLETDDPDCYVFFEIISDNAIAIYKWIVLAILCQGIDIFGIATNILNIMCFIKQGFKDPVNASLLGLAISDIGCLASLIWTNICFTPAFTTAELPFDPTEVQYLTSSMPHATFTRISAWITALITLERCLCITAPLKVKHIVTTERVSGIIVIIYVLLMSTMAPVYVVTRLGNKYFPDRNRTVLGLVFVDGWEEVENASYIINNTFIPFTAFVIIITGTTILVLSLHSKTKWRVQSTSTAQFDGVTNRNQRVAKMVVIISSIFIASFAPFGVIFIAMSLEQEFSITGRYRNVLTICGGLGLVLESVNSASNIFIYYHMSGKFRDTFREIMHCCHMLNYNEE